MTNASDAILFVTPEYNRSIPGALKNAIDWASRPWGQNSFDHMPTAVIGASIGIIAKSDTEEFLRAYMTEFRDHIERVLTVLPR